MPVGEDVATLALSRDAARRERFAEEWRTRYPIAYESLLPIGRVGGDEQTAVGEVTGRLATLIVEPTGLICSIVGSSAEAQAGLLLSLESLHPLWRVLVLGDLRAHVLPTVISRVAVHELPAWTDEELSEYAEASGLPQALVGEAEGSRTRLALLAHLAEHAPERTLHGWIALARTLSRDDLMEAIAIEGFARRGQMVEALSRGARPEWVIATEWTP